MATTNVSLAIGGGDRCLQISGSQSVRQLAIGSSWNELVIACSWCIAPSTAMTSTQVAVGLSTSTGFSGSNPRHFCGFYTPSVSWSRFGVYHYTTTASDSRLAQVVNGTQISGGTAATNPRPNTEADAISSGFITGIVLSLKRNGAGLDMQAAYNTESSSPGAGTTWNLRQVRDVILAGNMTYAAANLNGNTLSSVINAPSLNEAGNGTLDHVCVYINNGTKQMSFPVISVGKWS